MTDQQTIQEIEPPPQATPAIDRNRAAMEMIPIDDRGVAYQNFLMIADRARWMAQGRASVPAFLKGNVPDCVAVVELAVAYGFQPVQIARMCYEVSGVMSFMAQLHHAILNKSGVLKGRMAYTFEGEGADRRCTSIGTFNGASSPSTYTTPRLADIQPKNSPLWRTDPDQQMTYLALSRWVKRYCPEVFLGVPMREEMLDAPAEEHQGAENAKDVTPANAEGLHERLKAHREQNGQPTEGFRAGAVEAGLRGDGDLPEEEGAERRATLPARGGKEKEKPSPARAARGRPRKRTSEARSGEAAQAPTSARQEEKPEEDPGTAPMTSGEAAAQVQETPAKPERAPPVKPKSETPPLPSTVAEYAAHVERWLPSLDSEQAIEERWRSERRLRNVCQVTEEDRVQIRASVDRHVEERRRRE